MCFMMNKYLYLVIVLQAFYYAEAQLKTSVLRNPVHPGRAVNLKTRRGIEIEINPRCKNMKCPPITDPICTEMSYKDSGKERKNYIIMINKCEMNYVNCHKGVNVKEVSMKECNKQKKVRNSGGLSVSNSRSKKKITRDLSKAGKKTSKNIRSRIFRPVWNKYYKLKGKAKARRRPKRDVSDTMILEPRQNARRVDPVIPAPSIKSTASKKLNKPKPGTYKVKATAHNMKLNDLITKKELMDLESGLLMKLKNNGSASERQAIRDMKALANTKKQNIFKNKKLSKLSTDETLADVLGVLSREFLNDDPVTKGKPMRQTANKNGVKILKKPKANLKDVISKDELLHLLGDGLKKLNEDYKPFQTDDKHTILIDSSKKSPVASNNPIKIPNRNNSQKKPTSKTNSNIKSLKTLAKINTEKRIGNNNSAKNTPVNIVRDVMPKKVVVNKIVPIKKSAPMKLKQVLRESNGESSEADSSEAAKYANHKFRQGLARLWGDHSIKKQKRSGKEIKKYTRTNLRSGIANKRKGKAARKGKEKKYTFLCAKYRNNTRTVWISKKDYYKLRRLIKGLTPVEEIFKDNFFSKRPAYDGKPNTLKLNPQNQPNEKLNGRVKELLALAVAKVESNRYKAVLINEEQFEQFRKGEAQSIDSFADGIELQDFPSAFQIPERTYARPELINRRTTTDIANFFVVGFPTEQVFLSLGPMTEMIPALPDEAYPDSAGIEPEHPGYEIEEDGIPDLISQFQNEKGLQDEVDLNEYKATCPTKCPIRTQMVCSRCGDKIYRTFQSICHMEMFQCKYPTEKLQLVAREPCALSTPYLRDMRIPTGRLTEPNDDDVVLRYIKCQNDRSVYGQANDPRCNLHGNYYKFIYPPSDNKPSLNNKPDHDHNTDTDNTIDHDNGQDPDNQDPDNQSLDNQDPDNQNPDDHVKVDTDGDNDSVIPKEPSEDDFSNETGHEDNKNEYGGHDSGEFGGNDDDLKPVPNRHATELYKKKPELRPVSEMIRC